MNLQTIIERSQTLTPWAEGEKIPWNDPDFSRRILKEHLSQAHDAASRRKTKIKKHVKWIHEFVLAQTTSTILDLGCGPGLYCAELARLGHSCRGIDFSPASIEYAVNHSPETCSYTLGDVRTEKFGRGYDLILFIFGEFNVFTPADARKILQKAWGALKPGGKLLLEIHTVDAVEQMGNQPSTWYSTPSGLFSDKPHLCLMESFWDEEQTVATERYFIIDAETAQVTRLASSTKGYDEAEMTAILTETGFSGVEIHPGLTGKPSREADDFYVVIAHK
ncbi:MAG: class I SAM-dependent methyltransferase [Anaerolineales bacterium]